LRRLRPPPPPLFPYTTLFRSVRRQVLVLLLEVFLVRSHRRVPLRGSRRLRRTHIGAVGVFGRTAVGVILRLRQRRLVVLLRLVQDRKSTRLNSSHVSISYAVF